MYRYTEESVIRYQLNDPFVDKLVEVMAYTRKKVRANNNADTTVECKAICGLINKRFGDILESFKISDDLDFNAGAIIPGVFKINALPLSTNKSRVDFKLDVRAGKVPDINWGGAMDKLRPLKNRLIGINFDEARIENGLPEECELVITLGVLLSNCSDRAIAAVVLHEIGHLFHHYATVISNTYTNTVLLEAAKRLALNTDPKIKVEIIARVNDEYFDRVTPLLDAEELAQDETNRNAILRLAFVGHKYIRSELGYNFYDGRMSEQIADKMVGRFGLGGEMAELMSDEWGPPPKSMYPALGFGSLSIAAIIGSLCGSFLAAGIAAVALGGLVVLSMVASKPPKYQIYDNTKDRIKMLRVDMISALKNKEIDNSTCAFVLKQLDQIEQALSDYDKTLRFSEKLDEVANRLVTYFNGTLREETINKDLERMANNELFVATKRLGLN